MIALNIPIAATGKGRPRLGKKNIYTPKKTKDFQNQIQFYTSLAMAGKEPLKEAVHVEITIYKQVPKSWSNKKKEKALKHIIKPTSKPDLDNMIKAILDGMNKIAFIDDSYVTSECTKKRYAETSSIQIKVSLDQEY